MPKKDRPFVSTSLLTALGRAGGFILPFFIAAFFGAGKETDAFFLAFGIITALAGVFNYIFESVLLPYLTEAKKDEYFINGFANAVLFISLPVIGLLCFLLGKILPEFLIVSSGWDTASGNMTADLYFQLLPMLLLGIWISQANSLFYFRKIFWIGAVSPLIRSVVVLIFLLLGHKNLGIQILAIGFTAGETLRWGVTLFLLKTKTPWIFSVSWENAGRKIIDFFKQAGYQFLALLAVYLIPLSDQWFAGRLEVGDLSLLSYADRLMQIPYLIFISGMLQVFLSDWSEAYHEEKKVFWEKTRKDVRLVFLIALPSVITLYFLRQPVVQTLYFFSSLSKEELSKIADIFGCFIIGLAPGLIRLLYGRLLLILKHAKFYCLISWVELMLNIFLNYYLSQKFGVAGIAISTTLIYFLSAFWLYFYVKSHRAKVSS